jgi:hypothetical protein
LEDGSEVHVQGKEALLTHANGKETCAPLDLKMPLENGRAEE